MRKITQETAEAFWAGKNFKKDNTQVRVTGNTTSLYLFNYNIANKRILNRQGAFEIDFTLSGHDSITTRERLKAAGIRVIRRCGASFWHQKSTNQWRMITDRYGWLVAQQKDVFSWTELL